MAGVSLKSPDEFDFLASDLSKEWKQWRSKLEWYLLATRKKETDEELKVGVILTLLGKEGVRIYETFTFADGDKKKVNRYSTHSKHFSSLCTSKCLSVTNLKFVVSCLASRLTIGS